MIGPAVALALGLLVFVLVLRWTEPEASVRRYWSIRLLWSVAVGLALWRITPFWTRWDLVFYNPPLLLSLSPGLPGLFGGLAAFAGTATVSVWQARKMRPGTQRRRLLIPTLAGTAVLVVGLAVGPLLTPEPEPVAPLARELLVPDLEGRNHSLSEWKDQVLMVHFWTIGSPSSLAEMPEYRTYLATRPPGVKVVGVNPAAGRSEGLPDLLRFLSQQKMGWTQLTDPEGALGQAFGVTTYPTTVVLAPDGKVLDRRVGPVDQFWLQQAGKPRGF